VPIAHHLTRALAALCLVAGLAACANIETVKDAPLGEGKSQSFSATYDHTAAATLKALSSLNIEIQSSNQDASGTIFLVSKPMSFASWGEVGRIWVKKSAAPPTVVYVNWKKRATGAITGTSEDDFANALFKAIASDL
jgi:hypothetical protein